MGRITNDDVVAVNEKERQRQRQRQLRRRPCHLLLTFDSKSFEQVKRLRELTSCRA